MSEVKGGVNTLPAEQGTRKIEDFAGFIIDRVSIFRVTKCSSYVQYLWCVIMAYLKVSCRGLCIVIHSSAPL
jgi:hypothetical protein